LLEVFGFERFIQIGSEPLQSTMHEERSLFDQLPSPSDLLRLKRNFFVLSPQTHFSHELWVDEMLLH
jgi:hypothetical protein